MKNLYIQSVLLFISLTISAQVGVGTISPYANASVDAYSDNAGVLIPRVALMDIYDVTTIANPATGLYVFNTTDNGTAPNNVVHNNFYFWDGVKWSRMVDGPTFRQTLDNLNIPKLAGFWYNLNSQRANSPTGLIIVNYDLSDPTTSYSSFGEYMDYNTADPSQSSFIIKKTGLYGMEGFSCMIVSCSSAYNYEPIYIETVIQKSTDNGATWADTPIIAATPSMRGFTFGLTIPLYLTGSLTLNENDLIRIGTRLKFKTGGIANYGGVSYIEFARKDALGVKYSAGFKATFYP